MALVAEGASLTRPEDVAKLIELRDRPQAARDWAAVPTRRRATRLAPSWTGNPLVT